MTPQIAVCLAIVVVTVALYLWNPYKSLATTGLLSVIAFFLTKCIDANIIVKSMGNTTGILTIGMFVIAAAFNKTQFVKNMASLVSKISNGSLTKVMVGYTALAILMCQFIPSNLVPFCILAPLLSATVEDMGISPSKVMFPLGLTCITTCNILPLGSGATAYVSLNTQMEIYGADPIATVFDPVWGKFPIVIVMFIFCAFFAWRLCPDKPAVAIQGLEDNAAAKRATNRAQMSPFHETMALVIFFGTTIALILSGMGYLPVENWLIAMIGACLAIVTGVLSPKEATNAFPLWVWILFVCGLCMASALTETGASALVGDLVAPIAGLGHSNIWYYTVFFFAPYILTQFILNRTAITIFYPIVISAALSLGVSPLGGMLCVSSAAMSAFLTPMATGTIPVMMGAGGYDIKTMLKIGVIPFFLCAITSIVWLSITFPVF